MKKVKIDLQDLLTVLEALRDSGETKSIIFFEHGDLPAIADADDPDGTIITFQTYDSEQETKEGDKIH